MSICETFQQQALEVHMPDESFDPSTEPQNGEEYLTKVVYERNNCPAIVVAKPLKNLNKNNINCKKTSEIIFKNEIMDMSSTCLRSTPQWKNAQLNDFNSLRQNITNLRIKLNKNKEYLAINQNDTKQPPLINDLDLWKNFCQSNLPLLSIILRIDQRSLEELLEFEGIWLRDLCNDDNSIIDLTKNQLWLGSWIYSTLACLHLPIEPDVHSLLRDIAKTCITIRNRLNSYDADIAVPLNLFILIISKTFGQLDLFDYV